MSANPTILVIVDPQARHHAALAKGALLARKFQARMDLLSWGGAGQGARSLEMEISGKLRSLARFLRANGFDVSTEAIPEDVLNAALADRLKSARFVIKDAVQRLQPPALTAINSELTRACPAPLLLSKPKLWPELPLICAAVDPEQSWPSLSDAVMEEGRILANRLAGQLHVLHTHAPQASVVSIRNTDPLEAAKPLKERAADHYVAGLRTFVTRLAGNVFVVAGGQGEIADTTVDNLLQQIPCDLLVVKAAQTTSTLH
jgi:universal stress protein E